MGEQIKDENIKVINVADIFIDVNSRDGFEGFAKNIEKVFKEIGEMPELLDIITNTPTIKKAIETTEDQLKLGVAIGICITNSIKNILMVEQMKAMASTKQ